VPIPPQRRDPQPRKTIVFDAIGRSFSPTAIRAGLSDPENHWFSQFPQRD
jgi:hypothetical protein